MKHFIQNSRDFFIKAGEKISPALDLVVRTHHHSQLWPFLALLFVVFILSVTLLVRPGSDRRVFFFPDEQTGRIRTEIRYLPSARTRDEAFVRYVNELLLGPVTPRVLALYNRPATAQSVFIRGRNAYIVLSDDVVVPGDDTADHFTAYTLFKKNVFTNFRNIARIYLYIEGNEVYSRELASMPDSGPGGTSAGH